MSFGATSDAVEEVFAFVKSGALLAGASVLGSVLVERSCDRAKYHAWEKSVGPEGYTWTDIREQEVAGVKKGTYGAPGYEEIRQALAKRNSALLLLLRRQLSGGYEELLDDVYADLSNCALKRALHGRTEGFMEDLFEVYRSGGWPCGWEGNYPSGCLVAYYPSTEPGDS